MIRVDLGKDALSKGKGKKSFLPKINIPPEIARHLEFMKGRTGVLLFAAVGAAIGGLFPLAFSQYEAVVMREHQDVVAGLNQKADALNEEIKKFEPYERERNSWEEQKRLVSARLSAIQSLLGQRATSVNLLDTLGQSLPTRAWFTSIDVNLTDAGTIALQGQAYANEEISDLIERLSESIFLSDVSLQDVNTQATGTVEVKTFTLQAKASLSRNLMSNQAPTPTAAPTPAPAPAKDPKRK